MRPQDVIIKKRDGFALTEEEIDFMIKGYTLNEIPDYQMSSFLMAIYFRGMNIDETYYLTKSMLNSGDSIDFNDIVGNTIDKHSTGGVGDKTTFVVSPILAALGINVCKMSGRSLGYTGGTIDKIESIPGVNINLTEEEFKNIIRKNKFAIMGQTNNIAPADKKLYSLRDVTGTVSSIPLIASSIMSKKLALKTDLISLDIKVGNGSFMDNKEHAIELAKLMIEIGKRFNRRVIATLSSMNENLGYAIGNSLEIIEAIETLKGNGPLDFTELSLTLASNTIKALGITDSFNDAYNLAKSKIDDGSALLVFKELVKLLGGDISYIEDTNKFIKPKYIIPIYSKSKGYVSYVDTKLLGTISMLIGGGRIKKDDMINHSVGLKFYPKIGTYLNIGDKVSDLYMEELNEDIVNMILNAFKLSDEKVNFELILDTNL